MSSPQSLCQALLPSGLLVIGFGACLGLACGSSDSGGPPPGGSAGGAGGSSASGGAGGTSSGQGGSCPAGYTLCSGACVDLTTDAAHCGGCDQGCDADQSCCQSACEPLVAGDAPPLAALDACGRLVYGRYANEGQSNRDNILPDFSFAGYEGGGVAIPDVPVVRDVSPGSGDDGARIQSAIDEASALPLDSAGFRGTVLLEPGQYQISEPLVLPTSGVVLRGAGQGADGTVITATGTEQYTAIEIAGTGSGLDEVAGSRRTIASGYVGVGSRSFAVSATDGLAVGDAVAVLRTPNQTWIDDLDMAQYGWTSGSYTIAHERRITGLQGTTVTVDIPIVDTIEDLYGGGELYRIDVPGRIRHCGVEDLRLESTYSGATDEAHPWTGISLSRATSSWVRRVTVRHFGYSAVHITDESSFSTVEEVAMIDPVSQITGSRRYPFNVSDGVGILFQRCYARDGRHSFVTGARVTGPHVWLDCLAESTHADDGPHHRWATGLLFDNIKSGEIRVQNRQDSGSGHGWAGAQVLLWNVAADTIVCDAPRGAMSYAVGAVGAKTEGSWAPEEPFGRWESHGSAVAPRSLYLQQLSDRLGPPAVEAVTVPAQRDGRIWDALQSWAGEGSLADHL